MTIDTKLKNLIQRELIVFDFDDTLVDCNSDTFVHQLIKGPLPENLEYRHGQDYFKHVQSVLNYFFSQGITEKDYFECLSTMPPVDGMFDLLVTSIGKQPDKYDLVILSDANSYFIDSYLKAKGVEGLFSTVLTNPARFSSEGQLLIDEYHIQDYCPISARNLCKGEALKNYIGKRMLDNNTVYTCINYVGDGENDLCPCTKLNIRDRIFPRVGYSLDRLCKRLKQNKQASANNNQSEDDEESSSQDTVSKLPQLKARVIPWKTGEDILEAIMKS